MEKRVDVNQHTRAKEQHAALVRLRNSPDWALIREFLEQRRNAAAEMGMCQTDPVQVRRCQGRWREVSDIIEVIDNALSTAHQRNRSRMR